MEEIFLAHAISVRGRGLQPVMKRNKWLME